ncbi:MAG: DUF308 domain-containing protein [Muribaculaceae bacterium]|nr:DUF308 domain-containing protein [Muribaculaceae bacterium]
MKGRNLFLTALLSLAAGIALIIFKNVINSSSLVTVGGIFFIATGVVNMGIFLGSRDKEGKARQGFFSTAFGWGASAASVLLGLSMLIFNDRFEGLVNFMFAVLIAVGALYQLFLLLFGSRPVKLPGWLYIGVILLTIGSVFLFIPSAYITDVNVMLTTGISAIVFGATTLFESFFIGAANRRTLKESALTEEDPENTEEKKAEKEAGKTEVKEPESLPEK